MICSPQLNIRASATTNREAFLTFQFFKIWIWPYFPVFLPKHFSIRVKEINKDNHYYERVEVELLSESLRVYHPKLSSSKTTNCSCIVPEWRDFILSSYPTVVLKHSHSYSSSFNEEINIRSSWKFDGDSKKRKYYKKLREYKEVDEKFEVNFRGESEYSIEVEYTSKISGRTIKTSFDCSIDRISF